MLQIVKLVESTEKVSKVLVHIAITGFAKGSLIVMYTITVDEKSSLTAPEVTEDIKTALARNQDTHLVVNPDSLLVTLGKLQGSSIWSLYTSAEDLQGECDFQMDWHVGQLHLKFLTPPRALFWFKLLQGEKKNHVELSSAVYLLEIDSFYVKCFQ